MKIFAVLALTLACSPSTPTVTVTDAAAPIPQARVLLHEADTLLPSPLPLDTRTARQLAQAACGTRCKGTLVRPTIAGSVSSPIIPPSWTIPNWYIDSANSATCASDTNSGTAATCTGGCAGAVCTSGIGPIVTYGELSVHRWGCLGNPIACPRLQQNTTLTFLSNQTPNTDPVYFSPSVELGAWAAIVGALGPAQQVCAGTLSAVSNINVSSNLLTQATLPCTAAVNNLVIDSTNSSNFWTYKVNGAAPAYSTSQPMAPYATGTLPVNLNEVAIGNGDAVVVYAPVQVNLVSFSPTATASVPEGSSLAACPSVGNITLQAAAVGSPPGNDSTTFGGVGGAVVLSNLLSQRKVVSTREYALVVADSDLYSGFVSGSTAPICNDSGGQELGPLNFILGGLVGVQTLASKGQGFVATCFDTDAILAAGVSIRTYLKDATIGAAFIDAGNKVWVDGKTSMEPNFSPGLIRLWGTGTYNAVGKTIYPEGAGQAAATFKSGITLQLNGLGVGCVGNPSASSGTIVCNSPVTAANLDTVLGSTIASGCLFNPGGGGAFCSGGL